MTAVCTDASTHIDALLGAPFVGVLTLACRSDRLRAFVRRAPLAAIAARTSLPLEGHNGQRVVRASEAVASSATTCTPPQWQPVPLHIQREQISGGGGRRGCYMGQLRMYDAAVDALVGGAGARARGARDASVPGADWALLFEDDAVCASAYVNNAARMRYAAQRVLAVMAAHPHWQLIALGGFPCSHTEGVQRALPPPPSDSPFADDVYVGHFVEAHAYAIRLPTLHRMLATVAVDGHIDYAFARAVAYDDSFYLHAEMFVQDDALGSDNASLLRYVLPLRHPLRSARRCIAHAVAPLPVLYVEAAVAATAAAVVLLLSLYTTLVTAPAGGHAQHTAVTRARVCTPWWRTLLGTLQLFALVVVFAVAVSVGIQVATGDLYWERSCRTTPSAVARWHADTTWLHPLRTLTGERAPTPTPAPAPAATAQAQPPRVGAQRVHGSSSMCASTRGLAHIPDVIDARTV